MAGVRMTNPDSGGEYDADPGQVEHLKAAGWQVADPDAEYERWPAELQRFEGQEQVRIRHPLTGGEAVVARSAVPVHRSAGWVEVADAEEATTGAFIQEASLEDLTVEELKDLARARDLPVSGSKAELLERLQPPAEAETEDSESPAEPASEKE
jgi:hypothetical protein